MKKLIMSAIMCVALVASTSVMAQDKTPKKDSCCKAKTECTKDCSKKECTKNKTECTKDCKKECCKDKTACTKEKKSCCKNKAA
ncbi:hypothetical protein D0T84_16595 [Dysgonomonas sp. 521]|uniref:hypothetical protein n=1 Tax=Dysgonomonas sp. 521 TaxID=2302932 RepID=UPI0013D8940A|nr:hypothetical protein [Dysgonomonas sp. 521]NDV96521.1 hypothetical protein [Dysgonomonas sp. 521]